MPDVVVLNPKSNVSIVTLWTKKEFVLDLLKRLEVDAKVNIVGTLYTMYGINQLLYTLSKHPEINTLVVFGADLSGSGKALIELFQGSVPEGLRLMWPLEKLKPILGTVKVIDLREEFSKGAYQSIALVINREFAPGIYRDIVNIELVEVRSTSWPSQISGLHIVEDNLVRAWAKLVDAVLTWGYLKGTEYGEMQKQLLGSTIVLYAEEALKTSHKLQRYFSREELERHVEALLEGVSGASYSYGDRLRRHRVAGDQIATLVSKLASNPSTRRAVALTWDFEIDPKSKDPPCLIIVQGDLSGYRYNQLAYFRSHDAYAGWPVNTYGLLRLMEEISRQLSDKTGNNVRPGFLTVISGSLHLYEHDWARVKELVENERKSFTAFVPDPKGNFIIRVEDGLILLEHRDQTGALVTSFRGKSAKELLEKINLDALLPRHAAYLARELYRAENALREGEEYIQDAV
ncbi:MAG: thymidylate synthase [Infirmifilum sp.]